MNNAEIKSALEWRYAAKKMDNTKKISETDWQLLKDSLRLAPSSYGLQPWKFISVNSKEIREELKKASWGQSQVTDCSHYVVFATRTIIDEPFIKTFIESTASIRNVSIESLNGYYQLMLNTIVKAKPSETHLPWNQRQAYIAMGFLLETAALLKIDSVPLEGIDPVKYDEILGLKNSEYKSVAAVALGYRHSEDQYQNVKKSRFDEKFIFEER
jgi:nitroreductase